MAVPNAITRLLRNVRTHLPGVLDDTIKTEFFEVMDEFLSSTNAWREDIQVPVNTTKLVYDIESEEYRSRVTRLFGATNSDGAPITMAISMSVPGELRLPALLSQTDTWTVSIGLTVTDPVTSEGYPEVPDWLVDRYRQAIIDGILGRCMSHPAKPYTNERLAIYHMRRFRDAMTVARGATQHKHIHRGQAWSFPSSFATGRKGG